MTATRLHQIFMMDNSIRQKQEEIKALMKARESVLESVIKDGVLEDRNFVLNVEVIKGKRFLDVKKMGELHPFELQAAGKMTCTMEAASRVLSGDDVEACCSRYPDKAVYSVSKKIDDIVEVL